MHTNLAIRYSGFFLAIFSLALLTWGLWPVAYKTRSVSITQSDLAISEVSGAETQSGSTSISGDLNIEWPGSIRLGDAGQIRLTFTPAPTQQAISYPGLVLQSRLELPGIAHKPTGEISQALKMDHPVTFLWNLRSYQTGAFDGEVWLSIQHNPPEEKPTHRKVVSSQQIECTVNSLIKLSGLNARILGGVGLVVGAVLGLGDWISRSVVSFTKKKLHSKG